MDISLGTLGSESTFTNTAVRVIRGKTAYPHKTIDGSVKVQEAIEIPKIFMVTLIYPTSTEITSIELEYDKNITLNLIHKTVSYDVKFTGSLDKATDTYEINFTLQQV